MLKQFVNDPWGKAMCGFINTEYTRNRINNCETHLASCSSYSLYMMLESFQFQMALISDTKDDVRR